MLKRVVMQKNTITSKIILHEFADLSHNCPASFLLYCFGPCVLHGLFNLWRLVFYAFWLSAGISSGLIVLANTACHSAGLLLIFRICSFVVGPIRGTAHRFKI